MEKILMQISAKVSAAFEAAGYDAAYGRVTVSNRPDLCEYQCNGAMPAAKTYHKAPIQIANEVAAKLTEDESFSEVQALAPGFLNLRLTPAFLASYL
ncbi:MAG: arginine--tRNA ligase, partial [Oscillospiraceae bacterium]|nr:arginine--tRNA ligase [Oscillospiraceae bacterium]